MVHILVSEILANHKTSTVAFFSPCTQAEVTAIKHRFPRGRYLLKFFGPHTNTLPEHKFSMSGTGESKVM